MSWKRPRFRSRKGDDTADADDGVADELRNVRHVQDGELLRFFPSFHGVDTPPTCSFSSVPVRKATEDARIAGKNLATCSSSNRSATAKQQR